MKINAAGLDLIKDSEGLYLSAYKCPAGIWTIGWGCTEGVKPGMIITRDRAEAMLFAEIAKFEAAISTYVKVPIGENQFSALVSLSYNIGINAFAQSTLLRLLNQGLYAEAADQFLRWNKGGGRVLPGLITRRERERNLFLLDLKKKMSHPIVAKGGKATIEIISETFLKGECQQAKDLPDGLKSLQQVGVQFKVDEWYEQANHYHVTGEKVGWIFKDHVRLIPEEGTRIVRTLADRIIGFMGKNGYVIFKQPKHYNIVYVEGMNSDGTLNDDAPNCFNDLRLVIEFENNIPKIVGCWEATSEIGAHYTNKPMNRKGGARIAFGQYQAWQVGYHGSKPYEALVQAAPVPVHRDFNKDFMRTGDEIDTGLFGINQHHAWDAPKNNIGVHSAGCLVGRTIIGHREFMSLIKQDARYQNDKNYIFYTTVIPGDALMKG